MTHKQCDAIDCNKDGTIAWENRDNPDNMYCEDHGNICHLLMVMTDAVNDPDSVNKIVGGTIVESVKFEDAPFTPTLSVRFDLFMHG